MRRQSSIDTAPHVRRRASAPRRYPAVELACAQIGIVLDAPRAGGHEQTQQGGGDTPSLVDALFGCCRAQQKG